MPPKPTLLLTGDICIDWLRFPVPPKDIGLNWEQGVCDGILPLVFFDEFDSPLEKKLGWLKHFLAPMQDGTFRDEGTMHPVGKSIFVFAGGTYSTFESFSTDLEKENKQEFNHAKCPDFISRLRGYVNILGPNPPGDENKDSVYMIRRAMLLRSLLERKARHLFDSSEQVRIDRGLLRALINIPKYKHGARSLEAIIDMSVLNGRTWNRHVFLQRHSLSWQKPYIKNT